MVSAMTGLLPPATFWGNILTRGIGKREVKNLLESIAGGEETLTISQLNSNRDVILNAVANMRAVYDRMDENYSVRVYYETAWPQIQQAVQEDNDQMLANALEDLRYKIKME